MDAVRVDSASSAFRIPRDPVLPGRLDDEGVTGGGRERLRAAAMGRKREQSVAVYEKIKYGGARGPRVLKV